MCVCVHVCVCVCMCACVCVCVLYSSLVHVYKAFTLMPVFDLILAVVVLVHFNRSPGSELLSRVYNQC